MISQDCKEEKHNQCINLMYCECHCHKWEGLKADNSDLEIFTLSRLEVQSLIKELDNTYINPNENPLISGIINRMIKFVDDK